MMNFKVFRQNGKEIIINIENIVSVRTEDSSGKAVIYSVNERNEVDETFDELKALFGAGPKREIKGF